MIFPLIIMLGVASGHASPAPAIYEISLKTIDGQATTLAQYQGKTLLIVNTASRCGYTPQYKGLEALQIKYRSKGLVVLGFPSNDFAGQEPGSNQEIKKFCQTRFKVDFPLYEKAPVTGSERQPLFSYIIQNAPIGQQGEVKWNFEKFLIDAAGKVVGRFDSKVTPENKVFLSAIEKNLTVP